MGLVHEKQKGENQRPLLPFWCHAAKLIYFTALTFCLCREQLVSLLGKYDGIVDGKRHRDGRISFEEFVIMFGELVRVSWYGFRAYV